MGIQEYHLALLECRMAPFWALAQLSSGVDKAHPFRLFCKKTRSDSHSTRHCLFFKHSKLYKQRLDLKFSNAMGIQEYHLALLECQSALSKCRMAPFWAMAQLSSGVDKAHPFRLFCRKMCSDSHSTRFCLFFKHSSLYLQRLDLKIQHILLGSRRDTFSHSQISHPFSGILS